MTVRIRLSSGAPALAGRAAALVTALVTALTAGCASVAASGAPDPDAAAAAVVASAPAHRLEVVFDWSLSDRDARLNGRGVLRLDRGDRGRVDLYGVRGETYAAAIVEGEAMRVVPEMAAAMLPPAALLWSALGVFREPADAPLTGTVRNGSELALEYTRDRTRWLFRFGDERLRSTEWTDGAGRRTVVLSGTAGFGVPQEAVFRDWTEFRELTLRVTEISEKTSFDADTWILPGER
jgi:hypothetical protein